MRSSYSVFGTKFSSKASVTAVEVNKTSPLETTSTLEISPSSNGSFKIAEKFNES